MKGQSLVEMVFAVGIVVLVLSGVVALLINSVGARSKSFERSRATRMATLVVEQLANKKKNDAGIFWQLSEETNRTMTGFEGYIYSVGYSVVDDVAGCQGVGVTWCAEAVVQVGWSGANNPQFSLKRFFSRN
jgi:type II secretory pathway pseudopilin PulG